MSKFAFDEEPVELNALTIARPASLRAGESEAVMDMTYFSYGSAFTALSQPQMSSLSVPECSGISQPEMAPAHKFGVSPAHHTGELRPLHSGKVEPIFHAAEVRPIFGRGEATTGARMDVRT